jgi:hypothetical protein
MDVGAIEQFRILHYIRELIRDFNLIFTIYIPLWLSFSSLSVEQVISAAPILR